MAEERCASGIGSMLVPFLVLLFVYFGFFGAVWVDEMVLKTFWFDQHFPDGGGELFRRVYAPVLKLLGLS